MRTGGVQFGDVSRYSQVCLDGLVWLQFSMLAVAQNLYRRLHLSRARRLHALHLPQRAADEWSWEHSIYNFQKVMARPLL